VLCRKETSRLPHFLHNRHTDGGGVVSLTHRPLLTPQEDSCYSFLLKVESTLKPIVRLGRSRSIENSSTDVGADASSVGYSRKCYLDMRFLLHISPMKLQQISTTFGIVSSCNVCMYVQGRVSPCTATSMWSIVRPL
jgi:hypothetical protein